MGWTKAGKATGKGAKGCPTTNAAERALLDGYRMGQAAANGGKGKGGGKGSGGYGAAAGKGGAPAGGQAGVAKQDRTCQREGCRAAERQQPTWGGVSSCHCCGLALGITLPIEQLCTWAYKQRLEEEKAKKAAAAEAKGQADAPGTAPKGPPAALTVEQLALRRTERLAELKKAGDTPPTDPTALQQVAKVFVDTEVHKKKLEVPDILHKNLDGLDEQVAAVLDSLKVESYPWDTPMESPEAVLKKELATVSAGHSVESQEAAEAALQGTRRSIAALDAPEGDPDLAILLKRQERQGKEVARLTGKKPTPKLQKLALEDIQVSFKKKVQTAVEGTERGETKAKIRATTRLEAVERMIAKLQDVRTFMVNAHKELAELHNVRAAAKAALAQDVHALIEEKIEAVDLKQQEAVTVDDEMEDQTEAETQRDEAQLQLLRTNAQHRVTQSQQASAWEQQGHLEQQRAKEQLDAVVLERDVQKEAREKLEDRLAKLEEAFRLAEVREKGLVQNVITAEATARQATAAEAVATATAAEATAALSAPPDTQDGQRRSRSRSGKREDTEEKERAAFGRRSAKASPDGLPPFEPSAEQAPVLADLLAALKRWSAEGADLPISLHTLATQTTVGTEAPALLRTLLGEAVLTELQIDLDQPDQIIPRQAMTLLMHALDRIRDKISKGGKPAAVARDAKALAVVTAMRTAQKKRPADDEAEQPPAKQISGSEAAVAAAA